MGLVRRILMLANVVAALLFVGSSMAGVVDPGRFLWFSMLSYLFFPLLMVNVLFMLGWLFFARKEFLLSAVAMLLRVAMVPLFFQVGGTTHVEDDRALTVLTCNVHCFGGQESAKAVDDKSLLDSNAHAFLEIVDSVAPQVICMEEYLPMVHKTDVAGALMGRGYRHAACSLPGKVRRGVVLYSKWAIANVTYIDSCTKMAVDVVRGRDTVRIVCLHLDSYHLTDDDFAEMGQARRGDVDRRALRETLRKVKRNVLSHGKEWEQLAPHLEEVAYPTIVVGDFNDTPASYFYQRLTQKGFADCYREQGKGFGTTYHGKVPAFRIDFMMHSDEIQCLSYRRMVSDLSDHYPLCAQFALPED